MTKSVKEIARLIKGEVVGDSSAKIHSLGSIESAKEGEITFAFSKEHLERMSRMDGTRPRYAHAVHNPKIAKHLDLEKVREKCPSFRPLFSFVGKMKPTEDGRE